jgi:hypothetical protein
MIDLTVCFKTEVAVSSSGFQAAQLALQAVENAFQNRFAWHVMQHIVLQHINPGDPPRAIAG